MNCPKCNSDRAIKYGKIHNGKQRYQCKDCGRQFIENPTRKFITNETKKMIDDLLLEKLPLAGIVRVTGVSKQWLQDYVNEKYETVSQKVEVKDKKKSD